jgi:hypothetical protein
MVMRIMLKLIFWSENMSSFISLSVGFGDELAPTWKALCVKCVGLFLIVIYLINYHLHPPPKFLILCDSFIYELIYSM